MATDLIARYCRTCQHYAQAAQECCLLKGNRLEVIFATGVCQPGEMVQKTVKTLLSQRRNEREHLPEDILSTTFELTELLKCHQLTKRFTIYALKGYITSTVRHHLLPRFHCEDCRYLSPMKPAICQRETIITAGGARANPDYGNKRLPSDRACSGFEALPPPDPEEGKPDDRMPLLLMADALSQRAARVKGQHKGEYERHYLIFSLLVQWCEKEDCSWQTWKHQTANVFGKTVRTLERDLDKIIEFLEKNDVI